jgi:hypothetical protein
VKVVVAAAVAAGLQAMAMAATVAVVVRRLCCLGLALVRAVVGAAMVAAATEVARCLPHPHSSQPCCTSPHTECSTAEMQADEDRCCSQTPAAPSRPCAQCQQRLRLHK